MFGGGLAYCDGDIQNCIIWGNTSDSGAQLTEGSSPTYSCVQDWTEGGEGNTPENPRLVSLDGGDYRFSGDSPCIDQGQNTEWMWQAVDLDGNLRVWRGKDSMTVDMGAYEYGSLPFGVTRIVDTLGGVTELTWISRFGDTYTIWSCGDLSGPQWSEEQTMASQGESTTWADSNTAPTRKFYRVEFELRGAPPTEALRRYLVSLCLTSLDNDSIFIPLESAAP